ncbi:response regulator transcription factor [Bacillus sp. NPDC077411]|uniref:response regulator transcription factor n=1 Tax=Bacillus sp. NPDC077411 TaxID=3363947 RepID=UPI0037CB512C
MISLEGMANKKILLIDDEEDLLDLLETVLVKEGFATIYKAFTGLSGVEICKKENPDIIVLDIMMPDIEGYEVCKRIREFTYAPVIFLSAKSDDIDKLLGLGIGGDDYVTKPFSPKEVAFRIKAQLRRSQYIGLEKKKDKDESIIEFNEIKIEAKKGEVTKLGIPIKLTAKEYKLLLYMAKNKNQILSKRKICDEVWEDEYVGYDNVIMVHIRHLREKLEDDPSNPKYIKTIKGLGYKLSTKEK